MSAVVHLGVLDVAYTEDGKSTTTGEVAKILEANYGVIQTFVDLHEDEIGDELIDRLVGIFESSAMGAKLDYRVVDFPKVEKMFRDYLDAGEWENQIGNSATAAAAAGRSKRKKNAGQTPRVSFVDTGLYRKSFRAWMNQK